jgi:Phage tail protein
MPIILDPPEITAGSGAPNRSLPGSGKAIPTMVARTVFEINGLIMNQRDNKDVIWVEEIDGLYDADLRDSREPNPDRDGEQFYGGLYSGKPLVLTGFIEAGTMEKLEDMMFAFNEAWDDISEESMLVGRTGDVQRDWMLNVAKVQSLAMKDKQDSYRWKRQFMLSLRASSPSIYSYLLRQASTQLSVSNNVTVTNLGNRKATPRILLFGAQTGAEITNNSTGEVFRLKDNWVIPAGRYYEIDFEEGTIYDDLGNNRFAAFDSTSDWFKLPKRSTTILSVASTGRDANAAMTVYWRDTYK